MSSAREKRDPVNAAAPDAGDPFAKREAEITRAVTEAVTRDLARRHIAELSSRDAQIAALEQELACLHEELDASRRAVERVSRHPAVRAARMVRRVLRERRPRA